MNYILVYGLFNTRTAVTVSAYFFYFIVGNVIIKILTKNSYKMQPIYIFFIYL